MFIACTSACSTPCVCIEDKATCRTPDPNGLVLGDNVSEVVLYNITSSFLTKNTFSGNQQLSNIETLEIWAVDGESLGSRVFTGLSGLTYLGYHNEYTVNMVNDTFFGLGNLKELDFSMNIRLRISTFTSSMKFADLPILNKLTLTGMASFYFSNSEDANDDFFLSIIVATKRGI
ncbi:hypothetical protein DPMN_011650 [Dreissena polymorpha]|uniref:LRRNT domain-containing protein n=1 Tax=Dreissena polymorpha TaxID=45954 RepID=A0A9D4N0Y6_DREPO|nr:hypothetical protein DPMN_011650 [Dreissena polymorpha]